MSDIYQMRRNLVLTILGIAIAVMGAPTARAAFEHSVTLEELRGVGPLPGTFTPRYLPLPAYPAGLLVAAVTGDITVRFHVKPDGTVDDVSVEKWSNDGFLGPTLRAVSRWRFQPPESYKTKKSVSLNLYARIVFKVVSR